MKLKTLKDFDWDGLQTDYVDERVKEELKQEGIKWIKSGETIEFTEVHNGEVDGSESINNWIKHFCNIVPSAKTKRTK